MKRTFIKEILSYNGILIACFFLQFMAEKHFNTEMFYSLFSIYGFHLLLMNAICIGVYYTNQVEKNFTAYAFLAGTILQTLASLIFLIPLIQSNTSTPIYNLFAFMFPYFISLILLVVCSIRRLSSK